jgi:parvulin-like peptidyl-prolyl isomerase
MAKEETPKILTKKHLARQQKEEIQNRIIIIVSAVILAVVVLVVAYGILNSTVFAGTRPVAKVGNEKITATDFEKYVRFNRQQIITRYNQTVALIQAYGGDQSVINYFQPTLTQYQNQLADPETLGSTLLGQMVNDRLIRQEAKKRGITVSPDEVDTMLEEYFGYYRNGTPTPEVIPTDVPTAAASAAQLAMLATQVPTLDPNAVAPTAAPESAIIPTEAAAAPAESGPTSTPYPTATPYTVDAYHTDLASYFDSLSTIGVKEADIRTMVEFTLYYRKLFTEITADVAPTQDQVWARHILVKTEAEALAIKARYDAGENWSTLAAENSIDTSNKDNGGDLGWFGPGSMVEAFEKAAYATPVGTVSNPVQTDFGWHLIQVIGHEERPLTNTELSNLKDKTFQNWLDTAKTATTITKYDYWKEVVPSDPSL